MLIDRLNYRKIAKLAKFQAEKLLPSDCNEVRLILAINLPYEINLCTLLSLSFFLVLFFFFFMIRSNTIDAYNRNIKNFERYESSSR